jgi:hypothetical protein
MEANQKTLFCSISNHKFYKVSSIQLQKETTLGSPSFFFCLLSNMLQQVLKLKQICRKKYKCPLIPKAVHVQQKYLGNVTNISSCNICLCGVKAIHDEQLRTDYSKNQPCTKLNSMSFKQFMRNLTMLKVINKIVNILEDNNFHSHCYENFKPYNENLVATNQLVWIL